MATATPINSQMQGWTTDLSRDERGYRGVRHYEVDSADEVEALTAAGLPAIGSAWGPALPLLAARVQARVWFSVPGAKSVVRVEYDSPRASLYDPGGQSHTELNVGTLVATAFQGALASGAPDGLAIEGGAPREVGTLEARVSAYFAIGLSLPLATWLTYVGFTNANPITLPRVGFTANQFSMAADQVLYLGFEGPTQQGERVVVTHRLRLAPSHEFLETIVDDRGLVVSSTPRRIYGRRTFSGLW